MEERVNILSFFRTHVQSFDALSELLSHKIMAEKRYFMHLPHEKIRELFCMAIAKDPGAHGGRAGFVGKDYKKSTGTYVLQRYEASMVEFLADEMRRRGMPMPSPAELAPFIDARERPMNGGESKKPRLASVG